MVASVISKILTSINAKLTTVSGWLLMCMALLLVSDVIWRTFFQPLHSMVELSVFAMMIVITLGLAACEQAGEHVSLEYFVDKLPKGPRGIMRAVSKLLSLCAVIILLWAVYVNASSSFRTQESTDGLVSFTIWPVKFVMIFGVFLLTLEMLRTLVKHWDR